MGARSRARESCRLGAPARRANTTTNDDTNDDNNNKKKDPSINGDFCAPAAIRLAGCFCGARVWLDWRARLAKA